MSGIPKTACRSWLTAACIAVGCASPATALTSAPVKGAAFGQKDLQQPRLAQTSTTYNTLALRNMCRHPVAIAVNFQELSGSWKTLGWYKISPGKWINPKGVITRNRYLYYFAETTDGSIKEWSGKDLKVAFGGRSLDMRKIDLGPRVTTYTHTISCK